jgi:hypothetical protein
VRDDRGREAAVAQLVDGTLTTCEVRGVSARCEVRGVRCEVRCEVERCDGGEGTRGGNNDAQRQTKALQVRCEV